MFGLDTSVVLRLLLGQPAHEAEVARDFVRESAATEGPLEVSDLVVGEAYFALIHHYEVPSVTAIKALESLRTSPTFAASAAAHSALEAARSGGPSVGLMDRLIHASYQERGVTFVTLDRSAGKLPGARPLI